MSSEAWSAVDAAVRTARQTRLSARFDAAATPAAADARLAALTFDIAGIHADFTKTHLDPPVVAAFADLARATGFAVRRKALFAGDIVNPTESRAATHSAERGIGAEGDVAATAEARAQMRAIHDRVTNGDFGDIRHIIHIGIGGSFLGPALVVDALSGGRPRYDTHILGNIDGVALSRALAAVDAARTLVIAVSKSFTTLETMTNVESALAALGDDARSRLVAVTAAPDKAAAFGVAPDNILPFAETVGGRYSLWTGVGLVAALALGWDEYQALLSGAAIMDAHFRDADFADNLPVIAALMDLTYASVVGAETRAVFAYDQRLALLPPFLQQLETESNGKRVTLAGDVLDRPSSPVVWGGVGTDAQHAVFQLLHQGTHLVPTEFLAVVEPGHDLAGDHHRQLIANCIAQGAALMRGRTEEEAGSAAKTFPGDVPSATLLLDRLDARTLGALIAFYEHRTFTFGSLLGINSFDQMGVELGKDVARAIAGGSLGDLDASSLDLLRRAKR
ncbi:MAG: glucose-6-phosphate isomerase [Pseudomonadota bacterium]